MATPQPQTFRSKVEIVAIDASVLDGHGKPVPGLTAADFAVGLDGRAAVTLGAEFIEYGASKPSGASDAAGSGLERHAGRVVLLVIDDLSATPVEGRQLIASLTRKLADFGDNDLVGLTTTSGLGPVVPPTTDRRPLRLALRSKSLFGQRFEAPVLVTFKEAIDIAAEVRGAAAAVGRRECAVSPEGCGGVSMAARAALAEGRRIEEQQMEALAALIDAMATMPSPRVLVLLTSGIPVGIDGHPPNEMARVVRAAATNSVQLYTLTETLDLTGVSSLADRDRARYVNGEFMFSGAQTVSSAIGGRSFRVIGQGDRLFARILDETSARYRLSVEVPTNIRRDRPLAVRIRTSRQNVDVVATTRVVLPSTEPAALSAADRLRARLVQGGVAFGVPMSVGTSLRAAEGDRVQLGFDLQVPAEVQGPLNIQFVTVDAKGAVTASGQRELTAPLVHDDYRFAAAITLTSGRVGLRIVVADGHGNIGSVDRQVNVVLPQLAGLPSSGLFATWNGTDGAVKLFAGGPAPRSAIAIQPTVEFYPGKHEFPPNVRISVDVVQVDTNRVVHSETITPIATGSLFLARGNWKLGEVEPGNYTISATVRNGDRDVDQATMDLLVPVRSWSLAVPPFLSVPVGCLSFLWPCHQSRH